MKKQADDMMYQDALKMHASGRPGKMQISATKPLTTQRDLTLAYSPGVAAPCLEIEKDESKGYEYTARGNKVAVISNGTAVLGLGNIGAAAATPVMEGKSVLFKRFADIDGIDLEVNTENVDEFVNCVRYLGKSFGGINLEDIKAPECFMIEERLKEILDIPVFHDDQHGTAIITAAGLINGLHLTGRDIKDINLVVNGAGAASIACVELFQSMGLPAAQTSLCDSKGVIYEGRTEGMNQWKSKHAVKTDARTLADALKGADVFIGLSGAGAVTKDMVAAMAAKPLIFAMANPVPEIWPEEVREVRDDAIIATGRSDYPNQINNVLGFPYIFRGALDVRASAINEEMKRAAAQALAELARAVVPGEVDAAYAGTRLSYGPDYLIPTPFDPRLIVAVPKAVAQAAMDTGIAQKPIEDMAAYEAELSARLDPTAGSLQNIFDAVKANPKRVVFAEGEDERSIRAAYSFMTQGYGTPILIGREGRIRETIEKLGLPNTDGIELANARLSKNNKAYIDMVYAKEQRKGSLYRDAQRRVNNNRNVFGACMVEAGDADAMITGLTRHYNVAIRDLARVLEVGGGRPVLGVSIVLTRDGRALFIADTAVNVSPNADELADIAAGAASVAQAMGHEPRVAMISFSNFGNPDLPRAEIVRDAVGVLDRRDADFEYDGEMSCGVALNPDLMANYPFCRLSGPANVLVMPGLHSARISARLLSAAGGATVLGPILLGFSKPAQVVQMDAGVSDIVTMAVLTAHQANEVR
ncbi:MAG: NADP-dependent malic enzyme [Rhodospirillaceae bacterium]